ncbi:MAG: hypothetical protein C0616_01055 [Desulfuromonas sp.]|nr:MAG: hypothetical protein C0616_01055 [Desulfuromonas sp.]
MRNTWMALLLLPLLLLSLYGCGDDSSDSSSDLEDLIGDSGQVPGDGNTTPPAAVGTLGDLTDLGDLVQDSLGIGDHWYHTRVAEIGAQGTIVGTSNRGNVNRAAFKWEPQSDSMTYLGIHQGVYNDFYSQYVVNPIELPAGFIWSAAVGVNSTGSIIANSLASGGSDCSDVGGCYRAFTWKNGTMVDIPPIPGEIKEFRAPGTDSEGDPGVIVFEVNSYSEVVDINDSGEMVLTVDDNTEAGRHAYYWDGFTMTAGVLGRDDVSLINISYPAYFPLTTIVGETSESVAINENGQALVNSGDTAIYVDINHAPIPLFEVINYLPGGTLTVGVDINDSGYDNNDGIPDGHVIGNSGTFVKESLRQLLRQPMFLQSRPMTLQDAGLDEDIQGFFWDGGAMYPVDHLGGGASVAADLNNSDQVVGGALTADGKTHAFIWTLAANEKGVIVDLGTLGGENSFALAINESGQVTGWSETGATYQEEGVTLPIVHAFLWDNGTMYDLGVHDDFYDYPFTPPFPFSEGIDINDSGRTTGNSITINNHPRGFFLDPVFP